MNIETEVAVMQKRVEHLESNYQQLKEEHNGAMATLRGIDRQLAQIKWILSGAVFTLVAQEVGLLGALKGML